MERILVVLITVPDPEEGARIARLLVEEGLAACVNLVPGLRSFYTWEGRLCDEPENLLIVKTRAGRIEELTHRVRETHPYEAPEVVALPVEGGLPAYLDWVRSATAGEDRGGDGTST